MLYTSKDHIIASRLDSFKSCLLHLQSILLLIYQQTEKYNTNFKSQNASHYQE